MKRALLIFAMAFSLWPVAAVGAMILTAEPEERRTSKGASAASPSEFGSSSSEREPDGGDEGESDEANRLLAGKELERIHSDLRRLTADTQNAGVTEGEPMPETEDRADELAKRLGGWKKVYAELANPEERELVDAMQEIALTLKDLAANPTQETFDAFNAAIDDYNASVP